MGEARETEGQDLPRVWPIWLTTCGGAVSLVALSILQKHFLGLHIWHPRAYLVPLLFGGGAGFLLGYLNHLQKQSFQRYLKIQQTTNTELELQERRFRLLAENAQDIIFRYLLAEQQFDYVSPAVLAITGWDSADFYANPDLLRQVVLPEDRPTLDRVSDQTLQGVLASPVEYRIRHRDGHVVWLNQRHTLVADEEGRPFSLEGLITDITDRRLANIEKQELEMRLLHSQKLEAIGQLVGGIAHDFNNLLTVINGYSDMLLNDLTEQDVKYQDLLEIRRAGGNAKELTQQLLNFGSQKESRARVLQPDQAVEEALRMLNRLVGEDIQLHHEVQGPVPPLHFEQVQFDQILMNLVLNARDAMPRGGNIRIHLREHHAAEVICSHCLREIRGHFLEMRVSDDGSGMSPELCQKIFHPFYSTKGASKGRGLGLATVTSIVRNHAGHIQVFSEQGVGTTFTVLLPAYPEEPEETEESHPQDLNLLRGTETLLVVEDEEQVRLLIAKILREFGYLVHTAEDAEDGQRQFRELADGIDLVLTDVVMPGGSGVDMAMSLLARKPQLPIIFMSGYVKDKAAVASIDRLGRPLLRKPFGTPQLLQAIRGTLDG